MSTEDSNTNPLASRSFFYIARIVVQTITPLSIASGETEDVHDNLLVRDANNLPALPGSSIAGVLRHLYRDASGEAAMEKLFGVKRTDDNPDDSPSLVQVSWGCIHDSNNKPMQGLLDPADKSWQSDEVLKDAMQLVPIKRDHVKLTHKGVASASGMAKFDRVSLTAGHRFSFELSLWSDKANDERWDNLLDLLNKEDFRLGGNTRAGLGKMEVKRCFTASFDLKNADDMASFQVLGQDLSNLSGLSEKVLSKSLQAKQIRVLLNPEDAGYRIGTGTTPIDKKSDADLVTITEQRIYWNAEDKGVINDKEIVIPASGIKGAIRHRTAYYYNLLAPDGVKESDIESNKAIETLFGYSRKVDDKIQTARGKLLIDDLYIPIDKKQQTLTMAHNNIDRFTGGVREHMLFFEEVITQDTPLEFTITLLEQEDEPDKNSIKSLEMALNDLKQGRLALGAGSGRTGTGYFTGSWEWVSPKAKGEIA